MKFSNAFATLSFLLSAVSPSIAYDNENLAIRFSLRPNLRSQGNDEFNKCFIKECSKEADDADKAVECQEECVAEAQLTGRSRNSMGPTGTYRIINFISEFVSLVLTK